MTAAPRSQMASTPMMLATRGATIKVASALTDRSPRPKDRVTKAMTRAMSDGVSPMRE